MIKIVHKIFLLMQGEESSSKPDWSQVGLRLNGAHKNERRRRTEASKRRRSYFKRSFEARASKKKTAHSRSVQPETGLDQMEGR